MLAVILCSAFIGAILALVAQAFLLRKWFFSLPVIGPPRHKQYDRFSIPKELQDALQDPELRKRKESCLALNLLVQFLFQELKDTSHVRRWVTKRMNLEFAEMLQTTTGRLLDQITVRDFSLGDTFPVIKQVSVQQTDHSYDSLDEVSLLVDLTYSGGFQLAVDVELILGKSAYLYVKVTRLRGTARLCFSRKPFTHWSFSFIEDPLMDFEVDSQFGGRQISQITSLIINMIRRSVRKKHTLPNYKIRYRPFFIKPEPRPPPQDVYVHGTKLSAGVLKVNIIECSRLVKVALDSFIYCTLAIDSLPWNEIMNSRRKLWVTHDIEINKLPAQTVGLTFREEFVHEKCEEVVLVESVLADSAAALADIRKSDVVVAVASVKVTNCKHAAKLMKQAMDKFNVRIERSSSFRPHEPEFKFEEDTVSIRDQETHENSQGEEDQEDYVNISVLSAPVIAGDQATPSNSAESSADKASLCSSSSLSPPIEEKSTVASSSPKKGISSILGSSTGLFHRKRSKTDASRSLRASPEPTRKDLEKKVEESSKLSPLDLPLLSSKRRTNSDVLPISREKLNQLEVKLEAAKHSDDDKESTDSANNGKDPVVKPGQRSASLQGSTQSVNNITDTAPAVAKNNVSGKGNTGEEEESLDVRKTDLVKASTDPLFNQSFEFEVEEKHSYLNVCVWCRIPEKLDKQNRVIKPEKDVLLGHVSVSLMDVALDCISTIHSEVQQTYKLTPAEIKATASRTKLASHPGFEERLCYGDITLNFNYSIEKVSPKERHQVEKVRDTNEVKLQKTLQETQTYPAKRQLQEGKHDFIGTHFQSATYCNFCHKKIWLKVAFQCRTCGMICHKKCTQKCQEQTICCKGSFKFKNKPASQLQAPPIKPTSSKEEGSEKDNSDTGSIGKPATTGKTSFLSKFRKDSPKLAPKENAKGNAPKLLKTSSAPAAPAVPSVEIGRHNSLLNASDEDYDDNAEDIDSITETLIPTDVFPRTRSSTCLEDLVLANASPALMPEDVETEKSRYASGESSSETSENEEEEEEDEELSLLKFFEGDSSKTFHSSDEMVVTAAKEMGKELYAYLSPDERRQKLDAMVSKFQVEIDAESENRAELSRLESEATDPKVKEAHRLKVDKSDEKIQSLAVLMLHYCAGLQNCLDSQEEVRCKIQDEDCAGKSDKQDIAAHTSATVQEDSEVTTVEKNECSEEACGSEDISNGDNSTRNGIDANSDTLHDPFSSDNREQTENKTEDIEKNGK